MYNGSSSMKESEWWQPAKVGELLKASSLIKLLSFKVRGVLQALPLAHPAGKP